jgi:HPt (histidine-containing phosphotransfer) domain-containing protein
MRGADAGGQCPVDLEIALEYAGGDEALLRELLTVFLDESRSQLPALHEAFAQGRARDVMHAAHTFKGTLRLFGAEGIALLAEQLELAGRTTRLDGLQPTMTRFEDEMQQLLRCVEELLTHA